MNVFTAISTRRSIRQYHPTPISDAQLSRILEAGRLAPSAANRQPWHFLVVTDAAVRQHMGRHVYQRDWFAEAPVILVVCVDPRDAWVRDDGEAFGAIDATIALQTMILQATEEGLGTCWIGAFNEPAARRILHVPEPIRIIAMTPIGYAKEEKPPVSDRKDLSTLLHRDTW